MGVELFAYEPGWHSLARFKTRKNYYLALQSAVCYNQPMPCGLIRIRSLPTAIIWVAAFALAFGGLLRLSSPIQLVEVASIQSTCGDTDCCDDSQESIEIALFCCVHHGDCDCSCCHPLVSISMSLVELRRSRDSSQQIDLSIARLATSPAQLRYAQLPDYFKISHISSCQSLLKQKSLLIV